MSHHPELEAQALDFLREMSGNVETGPVSQGTQFPYNGSALNRLWKDWMPPHRAGDEAVTFSWDLLTTRVRDLFRNEPVMRALKRALAKNVVGTGIATVADVLDGNEPDDAFNFESDDLFEHWAEEECDVAGKLSWGQMQWQVFNEVMEAGECFLLRCQDSGKDRSIPLCYQVIEPEQIDWRLNYPETPTSNRIVRGVELDKRGKPLAYWIFDSHPFDMYSGWNWTSKRYPVDRVIHVYLANRPSENRGVTWFSPNIQGCKDLDWYIGNELTAAAIGALLTLVVKREAGAGTGLGFQGDAGSSPGGTDDWGNSLVKLGRGIVADIGAGDDIKVAESNRPNRDAKPFIDLILMLQGMGAGVSKLRLTGDYSQTNYSSARGAHLDDHAFFIVLQQWFARVCVRKVRREHTKQAVAMGLFRSIGPRQFAKQPAKFLRIANQPPGREQLDPEKETGSSLQKIRGLLSTWQDECGARGKNWRRLGIQQARERAYFAKLGLNPDLATSLTEKGTPPPPDQPDTARVTPETEEDA